MVLANKIARLFDQQDDEIMNHRDFLLVGRNLIKELQITRGKQYIKYLVCLPEI